jgi:hypothetical protein
MSKYTPGPWRPDTDEWSVVAGDEADGSFRYVAQECLSADARLIAAAPELLEALERLTNRVDPGVRGRDHGIKSLVDALKAARAAIAKATGEKP